MNAPERAVSANASLCVPGVNVPVAAPSCALDLTSAPSCCRVRPPAAGNWPACGCTAAASSSTAGGSAAAVFVGDVAGVGAAECLDDEPQPPSAIRATSVSVPASNVLDRMFLLMCSRL